jgi:oleate hydratase
MKAHIVGGGFGGLAAAACLIRNAGVPGQDITIYEAEPRMGGGFYLGGDATAGYNLPGAVFDKEYRCTFDLLKDIPSTRDPSVSVRDDFFAFNARELFHDRVHIIDRNGLVSHRPHYGLNLRDALDLARISLTPEAFLDERRIDEYFTPPFFETEFWLLWSTIMGSVPQHSAAEFRRYLNRFVYLFPHLSDMTHILRTPVCQYQAFIEPLVAWLRPRGVNFVAGAFVQDIVFAPSPDRITVERIDYQQGGTATSVPVGPQDIVLATLGSQAENMSAGSMTQPPPPHFAGRSSALWKRLAQGRLARGRSEFGNPERYFGKDQKPSSRWVCFTVTTTGKEFIDQLCALTRSEPGLGGLLTLKDSGWLLSLTIFHQPEVIGQPAGTQVWWGYGLYPERVGDFVRKPMDACTGAEILEEVLGHLRFDQVDRIMATSICIPCDLPYVNNIWLPRSRTDRPAVVPEGSTNFGLIGQYVEMPRDIAFTIEYSARAAWQAIHQLLKRGPAPPPVYQGQYDPKALLGVLKVFLGQ